MSHATTYIDGGEGVRTHRDAGVRPHRDGGDGDGE